MSFSKNQDKSDPKSSKHFYPMPTVLYEFMTQRDGTVRRLRPAATTLIVIAGVSRESDQRGLLLTKVKFPGKKWPKDCTM